MSKPGAGEYLHAFAGSVALLARMLERALESLGLSLAQYRLLVSIDEDVKWNVSLAERLAVSSAAVSLVADRLSDRGLIERVVDDTDRRRVIFLLTKRGTSTLREANAATRAVIERVLSEDNAHEGHGVIDAMKAITSAVESFRREQIQGRNSS